ncbi:MAG: lamin tail domain-containing protein [Patescibacteria group bacterium]
MFAASTQAANTGNVVINEIAWMGTLASGNDEWLELRNNTSSAIDLIGWVVMAADSKPAIELSGTIEANGFFLLERTDDSTVSDIPADQIYTGALGNAGEVLILKDAERNEIDQVDDWYAGDNDLKISMERIDPNVFGTDLANWAGNDGVTINGLDADEVALSATPRAENSVYSVEAIDTEAPVSIADPEGSVYEAIQTVTLTTNEEATIYYTLDESEPTEDSNVYSEPLGITESSTLKFFAKDLAENLEEIKTEIYEINLPPETCATAAVGEVVINEVAWMGTLDSSSDEWIELLNTTADKIFNLENWKLTAIDETPLITLTGELQPGEFFLLERTDDDSVPDIFADQIYTGGLGNSGEILILKDSEENEIDQVDGADSWSIGGDSDSKQTLVRTSDGTYRSSFEVGGNPRAANFKTYDLAVGEIDAPAGQHYLPGATVQLTVTLENWGTAEATDFLFEWLVDDSVVSVVEAPQWGAPTTFDWESTDGPHTIAARITFPEDEDLNNNLASIEVEISNHIVISEFIPNPEGNDGENEWIEIFNPSDLALDLSGWTIGSLIIPELLLEPDSYAYFSAGDSANWSGSWPTLNNNSGTVTLKNSATEVIDEKSYSAASEGKSWGRVDGDINTWMEFCHPTPGVQNIETNSDPTAIITIQGSGKTVGECKLYVNLSGEDSTDPDDDELSFEWDFGNGGASDEDNPGGFYFSPGTYTVQLIVTDVLGAAAMAERAFTVSQCSSGGSSGARTGEDEPIYHSVSADRVVIKITEVAFDSSPDWVELGMLDDGNNGGGTNIEGFYFEVDDKRIKTIPSHTKIMTGEFLLLTFKSEDPMRSEHQDHVWKIYSDRSGLTKTDEQLVLKDSNGNVEDAVVWENRDGAWSKGEEEDTQALVRVGAWSSLDSTVDSSEVGRKSSIARYPGSEDTNSAEDWFVNSLTIPEQEIEEAAEIIEVDFSKDIKFSEIFPNPVGSDDAEFFELSNLGIEVTDLLGWSVAAEKKTYKFEESLTLLPYEYRTFSGLLSVRNSGGTFSLLDPNGEVIDTVTYPKVSEGAAWARNSQGEFVITETPTPAAKNVFSIKKVTAKQKISRPEKKSSKPEPPRLGDLSTEISISEILANPAGKDSQEWIEISNQGSKAVNLSSWKLDDAAGGSKPFVIPATITLRPNEFKVLPRTLTKLQLNNSGNEMVRLFDWRGTLIDTVTFSDPPEATSLARDSDGELRESKILTPNLPNEFETLKLSGKIEFRGEDGFVVSTTTGEQFVRFGDSGTALLARAIFREGGEYRVFAEEQNGELVLASFSVVPDLLRSNLLAFGLGTEEKTNPAWLFTSFLFAAILFFLRKNPWGPTNAREF